MVLSADSPILSPTEIIIYPYHEYNGQTNMAVDHYFATITNSDSRPVLRFYGWKPFCLSIGYHQSVDVVEKNKLKENGYQQVRRPTGGRAIFHAHELTYSFVMPKKMMSHSMLYDFFHRLLTRALNTIGYDVSLAQKTKALPMIKQTATDFPCFTRSAKSEIEYANKKVVGSAQKIYTEATLQHGSVLIDIHHKNIVNLLKANSWEKEDLKKEIDTKTICLKEIKNQEISPQILEKTILKQLEKNSNISLIYKELNQSEIEAAIQQFKNDVN